MANVNKLKNGMALMIDGQIFIQFFNFSFLVEWFVQQFLDYFHFLSLKNDCFFGNQLLNANVYN